MTAPDFKRQQRDRRYHERRDRLRRLVGRAMDAAIDQSIRELLAKQRRLLTEGTMQ